MRGKGGLPGKYLRICSNRESLLVVYYDCITPGWVVLVGFVLSRNTGHYLNISGRWVKKVPTAVVVKLKEVVWSELVEVMVIST